MPAFVRYSRGQDVMAACGQLALMESAGRFRCAAPSISSWQLLQISQLTTNSNHGHHAAGRALRGDS